MSVAFWLRVQPTWDTLLPLVRARAEALGIVFPDINPGRYAAVQAAVLAGTRDRVEVQALEPPREQVVQKDVALAAVALSFGLACKRALVAANPGVALPAGVLSIQLDGNGLYLRSAPHLRTGVSLPREPVLAVPWTQLLDAMQPVALGLVRLTSAGVDHIVDKFEPPAGLEAFRVSRWRGDPSHRLTHAMARLELRCG